MQHSALGHTPFERQVTTLTQHWAALWQRLSVAIPAAAPGAMDTQALTARILQLQPRTLAEGMAAKELGWAFADGAGFAEWDHGFLAQLSRQGALTSFLGFLLHLRTQPASV